MVFEGKSMYQKCVTVKCVYQRFVIGKHVFQRLGICENGYKKLYKYVSKCVTSKNVSKVCYTYR